MDRLHYRHMDIEEVEGVNLDGDEILPWKIANSFIKRSTISKLAYLEWNVTFSMTVNTLLFQP